MAKERFRHFERRLCAAGIAARHARRAAAEVRSHYWQHVDTARAAGQSFTDARAEADARIGSDELLIARFASRPELRAFSYRRPVLAYSVLPPIALLATLGALLALALNLPDVLHLGISGHQIFLSIMTVKVLGLWFGPIALSMLCTGLARRHAMALRWPLISVLLVCGLGTLVQMTATYDDSGPKPEGTFNLGLGFPPGLDQVQRGAITLVIATVLLFVVTRYLSGRDPSPAS